MSRTASKPAAAPQTRIIPTPARTAEDRTIRRALRILEQRMRQPGVCVSNPHAVISATRLHLAHLQSEHFACLFLDSQFRMIEFEIMARGTIDGAAIYPREIVRRVFEHNAAAVILVHNHPSGHPEPSNADKAITDRLRQLLELMDVRLLDHIVVSHCDAVSFAQRGLI